MPLNADSGLLSGCRNKPLVDFTGRGARRNAQLLAKACCQLLVDPQCLGQIVLGRERFHEIAVTTFSKGGEAGQLSPRSDGPGQFGTPDTELSCGIGLERLQAEHGKLMSDVIDPGRVFAGKESALGDEEGRESRSPCADPRSLGYRGFGSMNCLDRSFEVHPRVWEAKPHGTASVDRICSEHPSKLRQERVDSGVYDSGVRLTPQRLGQLFTGYEPVSIHDQVGEEEPTLAAGNPTVKTLPVVLDDKRPAQLYAHPGRGRRGHTNILAIRCPEHLVLGGSMAKSIRCECGFTARGDTDDQVISEIRGHMTTDHPALLESVTREDLLSWIQVD
jgi:predicted small metal-binding protein